MSLRIEFSRLSEKHQLHFRETLAVLLKIPVSEVPQQVDDEWIDQTCFHSLDLNLNLTEMVKKHADDETRPPDPIG